MQYHTYDRNHSSEKIYVNILLYHTYTYGKSKRQNKTIKHISLSIIYGPEFKFGQEDGVVCM